MRWSIYLTNQYFEFYLSRIFKEFYCQQLQKKQASMENDERCFLPLQFHVQPPISTKFSCVYQSRISAGSHRNINKVKLYHVKWFWEFSSILCQTFNSNKKFAYIFPFSASIDLLFEKQRYGLPPLQSADVTFSYYWYSQILSA